MPAFLDALMLFLVLNLVAALARIALGPSPADRLLTTQLFSTTAVALLLLQSQASGEGAWRDVGLVFALLAAVTGVAFVRMPGAREQ